MAPGGASRLERSRRERRRSRGAAARRGRRARERPRRRPARARPASRSGGRDIRRRARGRRSRSPGSCGHGGEPPCSLREAIHDGVPAVRENHEERSHAVVHGAPQRLDRVERRAIADDGDDRAVWPCHPNPDRRRKGEPEASHGRAQPPERLACRKPHEHLGPARRRLLEHDRVTPQALGQRVEDVPRAQRVVRATARRAARGEAGRRLRPHAAGTLRASSAHTPATGARTASSAALRWASAGSSVTTATRVPAG